MDDNTQTQPAGTTPTITPPAGTGDSLASQPPKTDQPSTQPTTTATPEIVADPAKASSAQTELEKVLAELEAQFGGAKASENSKNSLQTSSASSVKSTSVTPTPVSPTPLVADSSGSTDSTGSTRSADSAPSSTSMPAMPVKPAMPSSATTPPKTPLTPGTPPNANTGPSPVMAKQTLENALSSTGSTGSTASPTPSSGVPPGGSSSSSSNKSMPNAPLNSVKETPSITSVSATSAGSSGEKPPENKGDGNKPAGRSFLQKLGGTKFVAGVAVLLIAIAGLGTSIVLQQQQQDIRQRASEQNCDHCGGYNQGTCPPNTCGTKDDGCDGNLHYCGGGCYNLDQTATCPGVTGCRNPSIPCGDTGDQCANVVCDAGFHCNGGACVTSAPDPDYEYITFTCDRCTIEGFCETDKGVNPVFSTGNNPGACAQVDRRLEGSTGDYEVVSLCDASCSGPLPSPDPTTTPTPSPTTTPTPSPQTLACVGISKSIATPSLGDSVIATCTPVSGATSYEFRTILQPKVGPAQTNALATSGTPNISSPFLIAKAGTYTMQCRVCASGNCTDWGSAGSVNTNSGSGSATPTPTPTSRPPVPSGEALNPGNETWPGPATQ